MGRLIDRGKRERAQERRAERRQRIIEEARSTFARAPYVEVTLDQIGQRAGVDRGVTSMYFGSKEALFLLLLKEDLEDWYSSLEAELAARGEPLGRDRLAVRLAASISRRPLLARFLALAPVVLEQNLEVMEIFHFQRWRRNRMAAVGERIELAAALAEGEGFHLLHLVQLLTAGIEPAANPRGAAAFDQADPEFASLAVSLEDELSFALAAILEARAP